MQEMANKSDAIQHGEFDASFFVERFSIFGYFNLNKIGCDENVVVKAGTVINLEAKEVELVSDNSR